MGAMAVTANCRSCAIVSGACALASAAWAACSWGSAITSAAVTDWRSGSTIVIGSTDIGAIVVIGPTVIGPMVIGQTVTIGARRCFRAGARVGGATESCASVVTASKRDRNDIRVLLGCAPIRVQRESPKLEVLEQGAETRIVAGRRIEHQLRGGQQVARLRGEAGGVRATPRVAAERGQKRLGARQVLRGGDFIHQLGRGIRRGGDHGTVGDRGTIRRPSADADADGEDRGGRDGPPHPGTELDDVLALPLRRNPRPHFFTGRGAWCVVRFGGVLQPPLEFWIFVLVHHCTHSPAKSDSATRNFARARDSWAFDVPVSTPNATPISSCV